MEIDAFQSLIRSALRVMGPMTVKRLACALEEPDVERVRKALSRLHHHRTIHVRAYTRGVQCPQPIYADGVGIDARKPTKRLKRRSIFPEWLIGSVGQHARR